MVTRGVTKDWRDKLLTQVKLFLGNERLECCPYFELGHFPMFCGNRTAELLQCPLSLTLESYLSCDQNTAFADLPVSFSVISHSETTFVWKREDCVGSNVRVRDFKVFVLAMS